MCEILFYARNNTHPDPEKDRRGCYKRGMPVQVQEDGHVWGRLESKQVWIAEGRDPAQWPSQGKFAIVKIPGVPKGRALAFLDEQFVDDVGLDYFRTVLDLRPSRYRRRAWRLLVDNIPNNLRNQLLNNGEVTVTVTQVRNYLRRIRDDAQYTGLD